VKPSVLLVLLVGLASSCYQDVSPASVGTLPRKRATECAQTCAQLGMRLSAMVVMMNSAGCVCEPIASAPNAAAGGASAAAGGSSIAAAQAAAAAAQIQQQQQKHP
jgi:hypothetical protein